MNTAKRYIKNSLIHIHAKWPGPNDARCCPAARKTAVYPRQENPGIYKAGAATQHWRGGRKQATLSVEPVLLLDCFTSYAASQGWREWHYMVVMNTPRSLRDSRRLARQSRVLQYSSGLLRLVRNDNVSTVAGCGEV